MGETVAERRRKVLVGELPADFLRLHVPGPSGDALAAAAQQQSVDPRLAFPPEQALYSFVPPNTRGRLSVTILEANLVKNYRLVRMDPYCRLRVGNAVFETQTQMSGGRQPMWNRIVHAYLPNNVESVYLQIFDERQFSADECVAWSHVILPPAIFNGETIDEYYQLSGQQGEGKEGMVHLVLSFTPVDGGVATATVGQLMGVGGAAGAAGEEAAAVGVTITAEDLAAIKELFPSVDEEVIRCVLEEKRGDKDAAVSALLEMN